MKTFTYRLRGITPLLMHNVECMTLKKPKGVKSEDWEASQECLESKMYLDSKQKKVEIPSRVIKSLLMEGASKAWSLGIKPAKGSYKNLMKPLVFIESGMDLNTKKENVEKELQFVTVASSKVLRVWPKVSDWEGKVKVTIADENVVSVEELDEIFSIASVHSGIGDYRPEFGRFSVERI